MQVAYIVLPTAGSNPAIPWEPDTRGDQRINATLELAGLYPGEFIPIYVMGGYPSHYPSPVHQGFTLAERMYRPLVLRAKEFNIEDRVVQVAGSADNTISDLVELNIDPEHKRGNGLFVSHRKHFERILPTARMLGLTLGHYDSGEDESIYGLKDTLLSRYATRDPGLVGPIGAIIKRLAEQNAKKERLKCARWADHNAIREAHYREVFTQQREKLKAAGKLHLRRV